MKRTLQLLLVYAAAAGCALLASCAQSVPGAVIEAPALAKALKRTWPGNVPQVHLDDARYEVASFDALALAANKSHRAWIAESWDCDDQTAAALYRLRVNRYGAALPPAVGRVQGLIGPAGERRVHDVLWCYTGDGLVRLYDATYQRELLTHDLDPIRASDH
jgi:hypothetical protein